MKARLTKDCKTQEEKKKRREYLLEHKFIFDLLINLLQEDVDRLEKKRISDTRYEEPNWVYQQADMNGEIRSKQDMIKLLTIGDSNG